MKTVTSAARWADSRMAQQQAARSSCWKSPASRAPCRMASGSSGLPSRPRPRSSASWAKTREVSPAWTMGWKWLVIPPDWNWVSSQPVWAATCSSCSEAMRPKSSSEGCSPPATKSARVAARLGLAEAGPEQEDAALQLAGPEPAPGGRTRTVRPGCPCRAAARRRGRAPTTAGSQRNRVPAVPGEVAGAAEVVTGTAWWRLPSDITGGQGTDVGSDTATEPPGWVGVCRPVNGGPAHRGTPGGRRQNRPDAPGRPAVSSRRVWPVARRGGPGRGPATSGRPRWPPRPRPSGPAGTAWCRTPRSRRRGPRRRARRRRPPPGSGSRT